MIKNFIRIAVISAFLLPFSLSSEEVCKEDKIMELSIWGERILHYLIEEGDFSDDEIDFLIDLIVIFSEIKEVCNESAT